ncbi:hypothetical protein BJY52DRAFT_1111560 [Lactarius psammicola]|nr:hypothetical protein BJY52DRAFT_1111560 [Lactarius psammicola]
MLSRGIIQSLSLFFATAHANSVTEAQGSWSIPGSFTNNLRVPVTLGVMSRCPDALLCETLFDKVIPKVAEKIDLSLTFVARLDPSDQEFGVTCRHGRDECAGNVQQLCAAKHTPLKTWWEFVTCQNYEGKDRIGSPDVALKCARTAKIDWNDSEVGRCAGLNGSGTGEEGVQLLQESVKVTEALGIIKSCTIVINGEKVCVHDGIWKDCENGHEIKDFIRQIEAEYRKLNGR